LHQFIPILIIVAVILIGVGATKYCRYQAVRKGRQSPLAREIERFPGQSLVKRLDEMNEEIRIQAVSLLALPLAIYAAYLSVLYFQRRPFNRIEAAIVVVIALAILIDALVKLRRLLRAKRRIRLACDGETIVGQTLNRLMLAGWRVFHDLPGDQFNIDHVVVGEKGVFAVETRTHTPKKNSDRNENVTVEYDGRALHFPDETDIDMIAQARGRSQWLADCLSKAIGQEIYVRAVLALPGWLIKRTAAEGMPVVNPKQFDSLFQHIKSHSLAPEVIDQIVHQLEQKWRDNEPQE
jgi:hypothetical protein